MCGIAGLIKSSQAQADNLEIATRMAAQLQHRGPDGASYYEDEAALLVHTRLSIIDLQTGQQPIHNEDKRYWVVFNGEIFNYRELRRSLIAAGHSFYTQSDTEVIVHLYEEYGLDFVRHLNGQFSICLWDRNERIALLVRDRVGIAPLYYSQDQQGLWFASEIKALLAGSQREAELNLAGFQQTSSLWGPLAPTSMFKHVSEVPPGHMVIVKQGTLVERCYWDCEFPSAGSQSAINEDEAAEELRALLVDAVQIRLRADVPVGAYLSGGLDSSLIAALVKRHSDVRLNTFSLTFDDPGLDERDHQSAMVAALQLEHRQCEVKADELLGQISETVWHTEAPIIRSAPIPMGNLSALVREQGFKVVLTGEGADEVFAGYDLFKETKLRQFWAKQPASEWRPLLLKRLYPYLQFPREGAGRYMENFFGVGVDAPDDPLFSHLPRMGATGGIERFLQDDLARALPTQLREQIESRLPAGFGSWSPLAKAQYLELKTLMAGYLLSSQGDRMLMKHSVEGRFPFLDHRIIEFANRLPAKLKIKGLQEKYLLKRAFKDYLPASIVDRHKLPYRAPMGSAFAKAMEHEAIANLLSERQLREFGYFDATKVSFLLKKAKAMRSSYKDDMAVMMILSTQAWHQLFVCDFSHRSMQALRSCLELSRVE